MSQPAAVRARAGWRTQGSDVGTIMWRSRQTSTEGHRRFCCCLSGGGAENAVCGSIMRHTPSSCTAVRVVCTQPLLRHVSWLYWLRVTQCCPVPAPRPQCLPEDVLWVMQLLLRVRERQRVLSQQRAAHGQRGEGGGHQRQGCLARPTRHQQHLVEYGERCTCGREQGQGSLSERVRLNSRSVGWMGSPLGRSGRRKAGC